LTATFKLLIRDRDGIYGAAFGRAVEAGGIQQLRTTPRSPWQNGYVERLVRTLRREVVDQLIVLGQRQLLRCLRDYAPYYNDDRPHLSLGGDSPTSRMTELPQNGVVVSFPRVGGPPHRYARRAA
jgi:transposase InsO family protein